TGQLAPPGVARGAVLHVLSGCRAVKGWVLSSGACPCPLPAHMVLHGTVTRFTADGHFGHRGAVAIGRGIVVLPKAGVVTGAAHRIPIHPAPRQMPPFPPPPFFAP